MSGSSESPAHAGDTLLAAARTGDGDAFDALVRPHQAELHAHCYRMLGSVHDAEDVLQEVLLRAWRGLPRFEGRSSMRSWLYRIATNACLNALDSRARRVQPVDLGPPADPPAPDRPLTESAWLEPYPDLAVGLPDGPAGPEARYEQRESVELAFVAALQHLPANQRAALILRDVLGFAASEVADSLGTSVQSVNSALQHARTTVRARIPEQSQQATLRALGDDGIRAIAERYASALERGDVEAITSMLAEDASWGMPPCVNWYRGHAAIAAFLAAGPFTRRWKHLPTRANGQLAVGCYVWDDAGGGYAAKVLDVLTLRGDRIAEVTAFIDGSVFGRFGLPDQLPA